MEKYRYGLFAILLFGLFYFSEGKPCPEKTRPHKTRCDAYYKCTQLTDKHVWVPARCEEGLIYEHSLGVCVLPADDWECLMGEQSTTKKSTNEKQTEKPTNNKDGDYYIVSNADEEENYINSKFDDGRVEIIIGTDISGEEKAESDEAVYEGSGNGGELVELDGFMQTENRDSEKEPEEGEKKKEDVMEQKEELEEMLQTIQTKADIGQPSTNIDPKLTAHLQRLSQLIDGLKKTYQKPETKPQENQMRPDQLNAFLAHFNIKNKFNPMDPNAGYEVVDMSSTTSDTTTSTSTSSATTTTTTPKPNVNTTLAFSSVFSSDLNPETKVVLNNLLPQRYSNQNPNSGGYSNSQIVVNRPEGSVLFSLPAEHHFIEHTDYSADNAPKISEETLKTVLELSKQMIASQNVPKVIPNPAYYGSPIMQPILLTPHVNSPFSSNYFGQSSNDRLDSSNYPGGFNNGQVYNQNKKYKKPTKRPQHHNNNNGGGGGYGNDNNGGGYGNDNNGGGYGHDNNGGGYGHDNNGGGYGNSNNGYGNSNDYGNSHNGGYDKNKNNGNYGNKNNGYGNNKNPTTIIHNNVIPVHVSSSNSGEKEIIDSYGQSLGLYPPIHQHHEHHEERPDSNSEYLDRPNSNSPYSQGYGSGTTTKKPTTVTTPNPYNFHPPTATTINQYFTPSEHLNNQNVNNVFQSVDNYGNIPRPMKGKRPNVQIYKPVPSQSNHHDGYGSSHSVYPHLDRPNSQKFESMETESEDVINNNYNDDQSEEESSQLITYTYGNTKPQENPVQQQYLDTQYSAPSPSLYGSSNSPPQTSLNSINSVFSTASNPYLSRPQITSNSYSTTGKNKYSSQVSPISSSSSSYGEGAQLVNVGGNFISYDVFQNSILPLVGGSQSALSSSLSNVEVITCAAGVRQPNSTDCTRYYVCSKKDGKVLSYSCPPYTAFNTEARICDAKTYALCTPESSLVSAYSVSENKRIQMETLKTLQNANRRQALQQQQQNLKALLNKYVSSPLQSHNNHISSSSSQESAEQNMLQSYMQQAASLASHSSYSTTSRPHIMHTTAKKRKYYCKEGDKIPDQTSISNYFVCYKNAQGQMKGHKMTCSKSLLFCPKSTMCTLPSKCS